MKIPDNILVRRRHKLTERELGDLMDWLETKRTASKRMRDANRR